MPREADSLSADFWVMAAGSDRTAAAWWITGRRLSPRRRFVGAADRL